MEINKNPMPMYGVDMFHYALMTADTALQPGETATPGASIYDAPVKIPGLVNVSFNYNSQSASYFADNGTYASAAQLGEIALDVQNADIPLAVRAEWLGMEYKNGVLLTGQINPKQMAVGYRIKIAGDADTGRGEAYRYIWVLKAKPGAANYTIATQGSSIAFQDGTTNFACVMRISDGHLEVYVDSDNPDLPAGINADQIEENFFTDPNWAIENIFDLM